MYSIFMTLPEFYVTSFLSLFVLPLVLLRLRVLLLLETERKALVWLLIKKCSLLTEPKSYQRVKQ